MASVFLVVNLLISRSFSGNFCSVINTQRAAEHIALQSKVWDLVLRMTAMKSLTTERSSIPWGQHPQVRAQTPRSTPIPWVSDSSNCAYCDSALSFWAFLYPQSRLVSDSISRRPTSPQHFLSCAVAKQGLRIRREHVRSSNVRGQSKQQVRNYCSQVSYLSILEVEFVLKYQSFERHLD